MEIVYSRKCPKCDSTISYKGGKHGKYACRNAAAAGKLCKKCMMLGKSHKERWGTQYDVITAKRNISLQNTPHWWQDKIVDARHKNGTYVISERHKDILRIVSKFCSRGAEHIHIKKILIEQNITWDEYKSASSEYMNYCRDVAYWTNRSGYTLLEHHDKRGKAGTLGAYQLDHIIEKSVGFINNIPAEVIGHISNLQYIPWEENLKKRRYPGGMKNKKL